MKLLDTTNNSYTKEQADGIVFMMNECDEDGWTYVSIHPTTEAGWSTIEVYDEDGKFIGKL